jgi:hypothetical protein
MYNGACTLYILPVRAILYVRDARGAKYDTFAGPDCT